MLWFKIGIRGWCVGLLIRVGWGRHLWVVCFGCLVGLRLTFGCGFGLIIWLGCWCLVCAIDCVFRSFVICLFEGVWWARCCGWFVTWVRCVWLLVMLVLMFVFDCRLLWFCCFGWRFAV